MAFGLVILGVDQVNPSPCHPQVPYVFLEVEKLTANAPVHEMSGFS